MHVTVTKENESVIYNGKIYSHGDSFDVEDVIGKSLMERGYVSSTEQVEEKDGLEDVPDPDLKKLAAEKGVSANGKKDELIARIREAEQTAGEVADEEEESADELPNTNMPE